MTRPHKEINWVLVDNLLEAGCLGTEIAAHFDMHPDTFYRRVEETYNMGFTAYSSLKREKGESILRAAQYAKAIGASKKGDNTLLIYLGKVRLNQRETADTTIAPNDKVLNFADAYIKAEAERTELVTKLKELQDQFDAFKSQADTIVQRSN